MANLNKVFLIGNLTRDPELRYTPSGTAVADFGMAVNRVWKGQDGQKKEEACFLDVQSWARGAEVISEYCRKGSPLFVEGRLQLDSWQGKDGQKRSKLRVVVENFQLLGTPGGRKAAATEGAGQAPRGPRPAPEAETKGPAATEAAEPSAEENAPPEGQFKVDDDIPF